MNSDTAHPGIRRLRLLGALCAAIDPPVAVVPGADRVLDVEHQRSFLRVLSGGQRRRHIYETQPHNFGQYAQDDSCWMEPIAIRK